MNNYQNLTNIQLQEAIDATSILIEEQEQMIGIPADMYRARYEALIEEQANRVLGHAFPNATIISDDRA